MRELETLESSPGDNDEDEKSESLMKGLEELEIVEKMINEKPNEHCVGQYTQKGSGWSEETKRRSGGL